MLRNALFLVGILLMAISLVVPFARVPEGGWFSWMWVWALGTTLALGAHGWPEGLV
jgi:hypothetical protein